jgi:hypothetical protein
MAEASPPNHLSRCNRRRDVHLDPVKHLARSVFPQHHGKLGFLALVADCRIEGDQPDLAGTKTVACPFEGSASFLTQCLDQSQRSRVSTEAAHAALTSECLSGKGGRRPHIPTCRREISASSRGR